MLAISIFISILVSFLLFFCVSFQGYEQGLTIRDQHQDRDP